jgi:hypothetical protein
MHFTSYYRANSPIHFDHRKRYEADYVFNVLRPFVSRKIYFYFCDDMCALVYNEYELRMCARIYAAWHNAWLRPRGDIKDRGDIKEEEEYSSDPMEPIQVDLGFHIRKDALDFPEDHFGCTLFPPLRSRLPVISDDSNDTIDDVPETPDPPLEEPDWCSKDPQGATSESYPIIFELDLDLDPDPDHDPEDNKMAAEKREREKREEREEKEETTRKGTECTARGRVTLKPTRTAARAIKKAREGSA